jgi:hypothetical protein
VSADRTVLFEQVYQICDEQGIQWFEVVFYHYSTERNKNAHHVIGAMSTETIVAFWNEEPAASLPPDEQILSFWNDRCADVGLRVMHATIDGVQWSFERVTGAVTGTDTLRMYDGAMHVLTYRDKESDKYRFMQLISVIEKIQSALRAEACYIGYGYLHKPEDRCDL